MNKTILFLSVLLSILLFKSCYDDPVQNNLNDPDNWSVDYPQSGNYGENILAPEQVIISLNETFSLFVKIDGYSVVGISIIYPNTISLNNTPSGYRSFKRSTFSNWEEFNDWQELEDEASGIEDLFDDSETVETSLDDECAIWENYYGSIQCDTIYDSGSSSSNSSSSSIDDGNPSGYDNDSSDSISGTFEFIEKIFMADGPGNFDREIKFTGDDVYGYIMIKIYENNTTQPVKIKVLAISN